MDDWEATVSEALQTFEKFVASKPDDGTVIDQAAGLTGAKLHIAQRTLEDLMVDYNAVMGAPVA